MLAHGPREGRAGVSGIVPAGRGVPDAGARTCCWHGCGCGGAQLGVTSGDKLVLLGGGHSTAIEGALDVADQLDAVVRRESSHRSHKLCAHPDPNVGSEAPQV